MATRNPLDEQDYDASPMTDAGTRPKPAAGGRSGDIVAGGVSRVNEPVQQEPFDPIEPTPTNPEDTSFTPFRESPELYSNPFDPGGRETMSAEADSLLSQAQSNDELFMFDELPDPRMSETGVAPARADLKMSTTTDPNEFPLVDPPVGQEEGPWPTLRFDQEASNREFEEYQAEQERLSKANELRKLRAEDDPTVDDEGFPVSEAFQRSQKERAEFFETMNERSRARRQKSLAEVQERRDLRDWQLQARRAQREGRPVPPMPGKARSAGSASFSTPSFNASGRMIAKVGNTTIGVVEDPTQPGRYVPQPGFNTADALGDLAFDVEGQESMDHLLSVAKQSGVQSQAIQRFDQVQKAAKNIRRENFASDSQYESAKADIQEEYGVAAKQLVDRQKDFFAGRKTETQDAFKRTEQFTDDVMREFESSLSGRDRDDFDQRSDQEVFRDSIMQVQRRNMLREGLMAQQTGRLTPRQSAQIPVLGFPSGPQMTGQTGALPDQMGMPMQNGIGAMAGEQQVAEFDDAMRAKYEDLPFAVSTDEQGGLVIQHEELGPMPGLIVSGYDLPVAIAQSQRHVEMLKRAGIPYVTPKATHDVQDSHVKATERVEGIEEFDLQKGMETARRNVEDLAKKHFKTAMDFADEQDEYEAYKSEQWERRGEMGGAAAPLLDPAPEKPAADTTSIYDAAIKARNAEIDSEYDEQYEDLRRQLDEEGLPESDYKMQLRELDKDTQARKSERMTEAEFMSSIGDELVAEELSRLQQTHERDQRIAQNVVRKQRNDYGPEFNQAYSRSSSGGSFQYTLRSTPRTFDPVPLRAVALGSGGARFPLAESPSHLASAAFDVPILVSTNDGDVMQTVIPSAPFRAATRGMLKAPRSVDGVYIDPLAEATVNVAKLIQQYYPGEMTRNELQQATEQMMRRYGYAEDSDYGFDG